MNTNRNPNPNDLTPEQLVEGELNLMELLEARMHGEEALDAKIRELWERKKNAEKTMQPHSGEKSAPCDLTPSEIVNLPRDLGRNRSES